MVDVLIVGGGPAGCSAALTLRKRGRSALVVYADGGALAKAARVENYPGLPHLSGAELLARMRSHVLESGAQVREGLVQRVLPLGDSFTAAMGNEMIEASAVLIATGASQPSPLPGESELVGRGVSYCATCDGALYRGKSVAVIGAWAEAAEEAAFLATLAEVTYYREKPHEAILKPGVAESPAKPLALSAWEDRIWLKTDAGEAAYDGVFILRPAMALAELMPELETKGGRILTHDGFFTSVDGVCAAGDAAGTPYQIAKAVGDGNAAALALDRMLSRRE